MKKILLALFGLLVLTSFLYAATSNFPMPTPISVLTAAQVLVSTPIYVGQVVVCSGCNATNTNPYSLCIGTETSTSNNGWIIVSSATTITACK